MPRDDGEKTLETLAATLDDLIRETVRKDLAGERWNVHSCALAFEYVSERLEIRIPPPDKGMPKLESRDICLEKPIESVSWMNNGRGRRTLVTIS